MLNALPTQEKLHELFEERSPGILYWRTNQSSRARAGCIAGTINNDGYCLIKFGAYRLTRHRIIWKMHTGCDPIGILDHINGIRAGDHIDNLRDVTHSENSRCGRRVIVRSIQQGRYNIYDILSFRLSLWPDENIDDIQQELEDVLEPIVDRIIKNRIGRVRPK